MVALAQDLLGSRIKLHAYTGTLIFCVALLTLPTGECLAGPSDLDRPVRFEIPSQPLESALLEFSRQARVPVSVNAKALDEMHARAVTGTLTAEVALANLLGNTGLSYSRMGSTVTVAPTAVVKRLADADSAAKTVDSAAAPTDAAKQDRDASELPPVPQESKSSRRDITREKLEEIVVTANKRQERVQDIPISIAVIGTQEIERRGLVGMEDYLRSVPGVSQIDRGSVDNTIVIRGITTSPENENLGSGTTVATYFDETSITGAGGMGAGGIDVRPVDLQRIEILRGPQGTVFGSSSLSGTLRLIPAQPALDRFSARVLGNYSDTSGTGSDNSMIQGIVNIPLISDKLGIRAVGYRYDDSGYIENVAGTDPATLARAAAFGLTSYVAGFVRDDIGRMRTTGGRVSALWKPLDNLDVSLNFMRQQIEQDGAPLAEIGTYEQTDVPNAPAARLRGQEEAVSDNDIDLGNLVLNYETGFGTVTAVGSWIDSGSEAAVEAALALPSTASPISHFKSKTGEARFASKLGGPLQFLAGIFYEHVREDLTNSLFWPGSTPPPGGTNPMLRTFTSRHRDQRAAFGEVSYALTDKLTATVGGRHFRYDKTEGQLREGGLVGVPLGAAAITRLNSDEGDSTYKASLSYKPGVDSMLYATWSQGFRLGYPTGGLAPGLCDLNNDGIVDGTNITIASTRKVDSDSLDNYEVGGKFALADRRVILDAAAYHIRWDGLPIATGVPCSPLGYTANAGEATSDGVEFQASLSPTENLRVDVGAGYTDAQLARDAPLLPGAPKKGARLPGSPKVNANLGAQYSFPVAGHASFMRADSVYVGKFYADLLESPGAQSGDYVKIDLRAGTAFGKLTTELFVRNLTNEDSFTWRRVNSPTNPFYGYRLRPRTIGIQLGYTFE